jgi:hypothetical protein
MGTILSADEIMRLSDDVFAIAQTTQRFLSAESYQRLLDAGLALRELAGLPMPWDETKFAHRDKEAIENGK